MSVERTPPKFFNTEADKIYKILAYEDPRCEEYQQKLAALRTFVKSAYALQAHRVAIGNRLSANFRTKLGLKPSEKETDDVQAFNVLTAIRKEYKNLTSGIIDFPRSNEFFKNKTGIITNIAELYLVNSFIEASRIEKEHFNALPDLLAEFPIYTEFLSKIFGMGSAMAAVIIAEINIYKSKYPSSIERYAGIDTVKLVNPETGEIRIEGRGKIKESHLVTREYVAKDGTIKTKKSISYNKFLKTKLVGVLGPIFIKLGKRINKETGEITYANIYAKIFDDYKARITAVNATLPNPRTKAHINMMANRYMIKAFIRDLYNVWRPMEGLKPHPTYSEAKLGHVHNSPSNE